MEDHGLDLGHAAGARRALGRLTELLRAGESPVCGATGYLRGRAGLLVATTERLLFITGQTVLIDDELSDISAFRARISVIGAVLEIEDLAGRQTIKQLHPRDRLRRLAAFLRAGGGVAEADAAEPRSRPGVGSGGGAGAGSDPGRTSLSEPVTATNEDRQADLTAAATSLLRPGEWLVAGFSGVEVMAAHGGRRARLVVSNRRLISLEESGRMLGEWPLSILDPQDTGPARVMVTAGLEFEFSSQYESVEFSTALVTAGFIVAPPDR